MLLEKIKIGDVINLDQSIVFFDYPEFLSDYVSGKTIPGKIIKNSKCIVLKSTDKLLLVLTEDLRKLWAPKLFCKLIEHEV